MNKQVFLSNLMHLCSQSGIALTGTLKIEEGATKLYEVAFIKKRVKGKSVREEGPFLVFSKQ